MIIAHPTNLAATLDTAADAFFYQMPISSAHREAIASLLISRQVLTGINSGFFIPFAAETETQSRVFTGELLNTDFGRSHIQLIECARILRLLELDNYAVTQAIRKAEQRMDAACYSKFCPKGECKALTIAYMRYLASCQTDSSRAILNTFLTRLADYRDGKGSWNGFPYFFTLLMLTEVDDPLSTREFQYASQQFTRYAQQNASSDPISKRRRTLIATTLTRS